MKVRIQKSVCSPVHTEEWTVASGESFFLVRKDENEEVIWDYDEALEEFGKEAADKQLNEWRGTEEPFPWAEWVEKEEIKAQEEVEKTGAIVLDEDVPQDRYDWINKSAYGVKKVWVSEPYELVVKCTPEQLKKIEEMGWEVEEIMEK